MQGRVYLSNEKWIVESSRGDTYEVANSNDLFKSRDNNERVNYHLEENGKAFIEGFERSAVLPLRSFLKARYVAGSLVITIPKEHRQAIGLEKGDKVLVETNTNTGIITIKKEK